MTNSREKFVAWWSSSKLIPTAYEAWLAGRESMKKDAVKKCDDIWQSDGSSFDCREAIKEIQP